MFILIVILLSSLSYADVKVGNGGDVVVCRNASNEITSIEALDIYEGRVRWQIELDLGEASLFPLQKVELALSRLGRISSIRAERYLEKAKQFEADALFLDNTELPDISDSNHLIFPKNCKVEQIIIQRTPTFPDDRRYLISNDLWKQLDPTNKAALILHEIIYGEALEYDHPDSVPTRYFSAHLMSHRFESFTPKEMADFLKMIRFRKFDYQGFVYDNNEECHRHLSEYSPDWLEIQFYNDGVTVDKGCVSSGSVVVQGKTLSIRGRVSFHDNGQPHAFFPKFSDSLSLQIGEREYSVEKRGEMQLHPDGNLKFVRLLLDNKYETAFKSSTYDLIVIDSHDYGDSEVLKAGLYPNGIISSLETYGGPSYSSQIMGWGIMQGQKINIFSDHVYFFPDGTVRGARISRETPLNFTIEGHQLRFASEVELYDTGTLKKGLFIAVPQNNFWGTSAYFEKETILLSVGDSKVLFFLKDKTDDFSEGRYILFYPGYKVQSGKIAQRTTFKAVDGRTLRIPKGFTGSEGARTLSLPAGTWVVLDENGRLLQWQEE